MTTQEQPKPKKRTQTTTYHSNIDWPDERPPLHVHLQQQEKRIRRVASKAVAMFPEYEEDMAQELRMRAIKAWETWDKEKGPLIAHTWRYIVGSHLNLIRRTWTYPLGYRHSNLPAPSTHSLDAPIDSDEDMLWIDQLEGREHIPEDAILARREMANILPRIQKCIGKQIPMDVALERLAAEQGELADVARKQGVSIQAVGSSRKRMLAAIRAALEVEHD